MFFIHRTLVRNQLKKTGPSSNPYSSIPLRNIFPKIPPTRKSLLHGLIHASNVLFAKSIVVTMLPDTAITNKIGANLKFFENWYITTCEKLTKNTSTNS